MQSSFVCPTTKNNSYSSQCHSGFLKFEEVEGSGVFVRRFFVLNQQRGRLEYFLDDRVLASNDHDCQPLGYFNINFISFVSDASSSRPKIQNAFYIVVSGERRFFSVSSSDEKLEWMQKLQNASKISVPSSRESMPLRNGFRVEIVGGVAHMTSLDESAKSSCTSIDLGNDSPSTRLNHSCIKDGYCVKQGEVRKNWKRRYFVLDKFALCYYTSHQDKSPLLRMIQISDIKQARLSIGIHLSKQNVFEIVTPMRVFYLQAESLAERDAWIKAVNDTIEGHDILKVIPVIEASDAK